MYKREFDTINEKTNKNPLLIENRVFTRLLESERESINAFFKKVLEDKRKCLEEDLISKGEKGYF